MNQVTISPQCDGCLKCDELLPGLSDYLTEGRLIISIANTERYSAEIERAIDGCPKNALMVEKLR